MKARVVTIRRIILICMLSIAVLGSAMHVFAEKVDDTEVGETNTSNEIIPTNGYLESADAIYFLRFVLNDAGGFWGDISDDIIINSDLYKMCTGQLAGTDKETEVIKAFLLFLYPQVNRYVEQGNSVLRNSRAQLQSYLEDKCAGMSSLDEEAFNEVRNEALKQVENGLIDILCSELAINTGIVVTKDVLNDIKTASGVYGGIMSLPDKIESFVNTVVTAVSTCLMPMGSELSGRYTYFASYLDCRNLGGPDDIVFQAAMDYNFMACKKNAGLAAGFINFLPGGKVNWTEKRNLIDHWAEFVYQLEQKRDGQPMGTIDTSTYYYENPTEDETIDFNWKLYDNGNLVIWGKEETGTIAYTVAPWKAQKDKIRRLFIAEGVTSIGSSVFSGYPNLQYISISNGVTSIGEYAFSGCTGIKELTIPDNVTDIGKGAFSGCTGIETLTCPGTYNYYHYYTEGVGGAFGGCSGIKQINLTGNGAMPQYGRQSGSSYKVMNQFTPWMIASNAGNEINVTVNEGLTSIGSGAFYNCEGLVQIDIADSVEVIENKAFERCSYLENVELPDSITSIGENVFCNCKELTEIFIPSGVTTIPNGCYQYCTGIEKIHITDELTTIGEYAFSGCTGIKELTIPDNVTDIGKGAFSGCTGIETLTCPGTYNYYHYYTEGVGGAFGGCSGIKQINLTGNGAMPQYGRQSGSSYKVMNQFTPWMIASNAGNEINVTVNEGLTSIGSGAFYNCEGLVQIDIAGSVEIIENKAFERCSNLNTILFRGCAPAINSNSFSSIIASAYYSSDETWTDLVKQNYGGIITWLPMESIEMDSLVLPTSLKTVGEEAFMGGNFTYVKMPEGATRIDSRAFAYCMNMRFIEIPTSTTSIATDAFDGVNGLTIIGKTGSYAQTYAETNGLIFSSSGEMRY